MFSYFAMKSIAVITEETLFLKLSLLVYCRKSEALKLQVFFPDWLFIIIIIISSRTFETIDSASQDWDYAQLPEK